MKKNSVLLMGACALFSLSANAQSSISVVRSQKISNGNGNFGTNTITSDDRFGDAVANIGDLDGDGNPDLAVGADYFDTQTTSQAGQVYILFLDSNGTVKNKVRHTIPGASRFGLSVCALGDLDGDGTRDIAVGAVGNDNFKGAVYICFMKSDGSIKSSSIIKTGTQNFTTLNEGAIFGSKTVNAGDMNGDGVTDILVGAPTDPDGGPSKGSVFIIYLNTNGSVKGYKKLSATSGNLPFTLNSGDEFGSAIAPIGDIDNDGVTDIAVGAYKDDDGYTEAGALYILKMNSNGSVKSSTKISNSNSIINGSLATGTRLGVSVVRLSNYSIKGGFTLATGVRDDISSTVPKGAVFLLNFSPDGVLKSYSKIGDKSTGFANSLDNDDRFGLDITDMGSVGNESTGKKKRIAVGAAFDDDGVTNAGAVYIIDIDQQNTAAINSDLASASAPQMSVFPNPFTSGLNVNLSGDRSAIYNIMISGLDGRIIYQAPHRVNEGQQSIRLTQLSDLAPGVYYLSVSDGKGAAAIEKIVKTQ